MTDSGAIPVPHGPFEAYLGQEIIELRLDVASLKASRRTWGWIAGLGIPALIGGAFLVMLWSVDNVRTSAERVGETKAEIKALGKLIDLLESDVAELRRHAGLDGKPVSITLGP